MDYAELREGTVDAGFGAAVGVYVHLSGLEAASSVGVAIVVFVLFQFVMAMSREAIEWFLDRRKER